jgi:hypothetical protein
MALNSCKRKCASTPVSDGVSSISQDFHRTACAVPLLIQRPSIWSAFFERAVQRSLELDDVFADLKRCNAPAGRLEFENDFEPILVREGSSSTRPAVERAQEDVASFLDVCCRSAFDRRGRKVVGDDACQRSEVPQSSASTLTAIDAVLRAQWPDIMRERSPA